MPTTNDNRHKIQPKPTTMIEPPINQNLSQATQPQTIAQEVHPLPCVAVLGGGSWATALVKILLETRRVRIRWWLRDQNQIDYIKTHHRNPKYLSQLQLDLKRIKIGSKLQKYVSKADFVVVAIPSAFVQDALKELTPHDFENKIVVSAIKGIIPEKNLVINDFFAQEFGVEPHNFCVIAGPCHAEEVAQEKLSYLTIGSEDMAAAQKVADLLACRFIKTRALHDAVGVEYCAVLKNIYALAGGIAHGVGYGDNFHAVLISNAIQEAERFLNAINIKDREVMSSAYLGDLLVTAYSQYSRNRTFGSMIGRGYSVKFAQLEMNMIAEGYYATKSICEINKKYQVDMPIVDSVYRILYDKAQPQLELLALSEKLS